MGDLSEWEIIEMAELKKEIGRTECVYDKRVGESDVCFLFLFVLPAENNVRKKIYFYK